MGGGSAPSASAPFDILGLASTAANARPNSSALSGLDFNAAPAPAAAPAPNGNVWAAKAALREKEREVERTTEKDEAEVEKAKDEAAKADEALKEKEAGIDPAEYNSMLEKVKTLHDEIDQLKTSQADKMEDLKKADEAKLVAVEAKDKKKEDEIAAEGEAKVVEATGLKAEEENAALARRRSSNSQLNTLLTKIESPGGGESRRRQAIPEGAAEIGRAHV